MVTIYPASIDNTTSLPYLTITSVITPDSINVLRDTIVAVETTLGVKPQGVYGTVRARLDNIETAVGNILSGTITGGGIQIAGDIGGTQINPVVIGIQTIPVSSTPPTTGQILIYNGSVYVPSNNFGAQNLVTTGQITSGPVLATSIDTGFVINNGKFIFNAITAPAVSDPGQAIMYYDQTTNQLLISQNGNAYFNFDTTTPITHLVSNANYVISETANDIFVGFSGLTTNRTITLPASPGTGMRIYIKDKDGSLGLNSMVISGNGNTIDGSSNFTMNLSNPGSKGSIILWFDGTGWNIV